MYSTNRSETASTLFVQLQDSVKGANTDKATELLRELQNDFDGTPYAATGFVDGGRCIV